MKTLGLLGGMSWQSTQTYYQLINEGVNQRLGGLHSAELLISSIDFAPMEALQVEGDWESAGELLASQAVKLARAGAEAIVVCTNTMHKVADQIEASIEVPLLHIADATGQQLAQKDIKCAALLGTAFTMEQGFYKQRLIDDFGIDVLVPEAAGRQQVHEIIYQELCHGDIRDDSRERYLQIIDQLTQRGAQIIILGCTEIGLLVKQEDTVASLIDTTIVHAQTAVDFMLSS